MALRSAGRAGFSASLGAVAERIVHAARGHRLALFLMTLAASAACFRLLPGDTLPGSLVQAAVIAAVAVLAVALGRPAALGLPAANRTGAERAAACCAKTGSSGSAGPDTGGETASRDAASESFSFDGCRGRWGVLGRWTVAVLAIGALAGAASWWTLAGGAATGVAEGAASGLDPVLSRDGGNVSDPLFLLGPIALLCLLTGVFEEGVFRVLALDALAPAFCRDRQARSGERRAASVLGPEPAVRQSGVLGAAVASSALFGVLHVSAVDAAAAASAVAWAQFALKPVQAGLFGFFMAALFVRTGSLWKAAGVHGLFNLLYLGPVLAAGVLSPTYVTGSFVDLALLAATTLLLVPPAIAAARTIRSTN